MSAECQWRNFENRSIAGEYMDKNKVPRFLAHPGVYSALPAVGFSLIENAVSWSNKQKFCCDCPECTMLYSRRTSSSCSAQTLSSHTAIYWTSMSSTVTCFTSITDRADYRNSSNCSLYLPVCWCFGNHFCLKNYKQTTWNGALAQHFFTLCIGLCSVCTIRNCSLSLYLNIGGLRGGPG